MRHRPIDLKRTYLIIALIAFLLCGASTLSAKSSRYLKHFPADCNPELIGAKLAGRFAATGKHALHMNRWIGYPETFVWNGALRFAQLTKRKALLDSLTVRFDTLTTHQRQLLPPMYHVDMNMFGSLPLLLYQISHDKRYLEFGLPYADTQWALPDHPNAAPQRWADEGYSWQTRVWIDDMYMITVVQTAAYKATGNAAYYERAAKEMKLYLDSLQCPNGLFYHAPDVPYFWGRGNGWVACGMTELLKILPKNNPYYTPILNSYRKMMASLKAYQNEEGLWRQLLDKSDCWTETSGSAMFTYALINGVRQGWLNEKEYGPIARKAWIGLCKYLTPDGKVRSVCAGTNKKNDEAYYYKRPRRTGDYHGQAPYLWCVDALLE